MISSSMKMQFESVLRKQHLSDVAASFSDPDFFDEIPLYSRYKQIEFLKQFGDVNVLLIKLALEYLHRVTSEVHLRTKRFVAITVISDDDDEYLVPAIFVCNGNVKTRLKALHLSSPSEGIGKRIAGYVKNAKLHNEFSVLEDDYTIPDDVRIFVGHKSPPAGLVNLETFANGVEKRRPVQKT